MELLVTFFSDQASQSIRKPEYEGFCVCGGGGGGVVIFLMLIV